MTSNSQKSLAVGASVLVNGGFLLAVAGLAPQPMPPPVEVPVFEVALERPVRPSVAKAAPPASEVQTSASTDNNASENLSPVAVSSPQPSLSSVPVAAILAPQAALDSDWTEPAAATTSAAPPAAAAPSAPRAAASASRQSAAQGRPTAAYAARLRHHIEQFKIYPPQAKRRRLEGEVVLSFQMDRQGRVLTSRIEHGSGSADIDRAALAMLNESQPLPHPPDSLTGEVLSLTFATRFSLSD